MLFKLKVNEFEFEFICKYRNTRHGFAHDCKLYVSTENYGVLNVINATCYYYNRTWECYHFQSAILASLRKLEKAIRDIHRQVFMQENNYSRLTKKRETAFLIALNDCNDWHSIEKAIDYMRSYDGEKAGCLNNTGFECMFEGITIE